MKMNDNLVSFLQARNEERANELSKLLKNEQEWLRTCKDSQAALIIASLELPVRVIRLEETNQILNDKKKTRFALQSSQLSLMRTLHGHRNELAKTVKFVGWPGIHISLDDEKDEIRELLENIDCIPVFPPETEFEIFNEFCHIFLWSLFHNILNTEELNNTPFDHEQWRVYHQMNMLWSSVITPIVSPEHMDMVWINDYHLLLLCQYMTRKVKGVNIGLFLHIPFPSYEIFRCLPVREELLRSILMADLIGFHFFPYAKQFLSSCKRLLGVDHYFKPGGLIGIDKNSTNGAQKIGIDHEFNSNKQETIVRIGHVHIQCDDILQMIASNQEIRLKALDIRERHKNHFIFISIDRLDQLSGLQLKLRAFDNFLQNYPYLKVKQPVVLIQYIFPTNTLTFEKREKLIHSLINLTNEINLKHSSKSPDSINSPKSNHSHSPLNNLIIFENPVIELKYGPITQEEKYALFLSGDCLFDTSVRDGLNVNPFEYITCKDESLKILNQYQSLNTPISTSSFSSSSSSEQGESSGNDDYNKKFVSANKIVTGPCCALKSHKLLPSLIISEFTGCSNTLSSPYRVNPWNVMNVVETLDKAVSSIKHISQEKRHHWRMDRAYLLSHSTVDWAKEFIMDLYIFSKKKKNDTFYHITYGIGPSLKGICINLNSQHLNLNLLTQIYKKSSNKSLRVFLFDNEGTLTPDYRHFFDKKTSLSNNITNRNSICTSVTNLDLNKKLNIPKNLNEDLTNIQNSNSILNATKIQSEDGKVAILNDEVYTSIESLSIDNSNQIDPLISDEEGSKLIDDIFSNEISCAPPNQIKEALKKLCSSPNNVVIVFSGREKHLLDEWFGDIDNIGLCAEHGYFLKLPKSIDNETPNVWKQLKITHFQNGINLNMNSNLAESLNNQISSNTVTMPIVYSAEITSEKCGNNIENNASKNEENSEISNLKINVMDWKNITLQLMEQYVLRTQGSYIENKGTALVFQYKFCEPYFGTWQAKELSNYLVELLLNYPVNVITGIDYVEVRLNGINKGVAVQAIIDQIECVNKEKIDMILCIGDDRSDEDMFSVVNKYSRSHSNSKMEQSKSDIEETPIIEGKQYIENSQSNLNIFTVVIGKHTSTANYFLHSTEEVSDILQTLTLFT